MTLLFLLSLPEPLAAVLSDVAEPTGQGRKCSQDKGFALTGKSKLNRLELTSLDAGAVAAEIILEVDATNAG